MQAAGACLHAACAAYGRATLRLRRLQPLMEGVDPARHYIACDQSALAGFDENNFTVKDVKVLFVCFVPCLDSINRFALVVPRLVYKPYDAPSCKNRATNVTLSGTSL